MGGLAYVRQGAGATLLLLHGLGSSRAAWEPVLPALARHFDVLAVDLPGFGDSASAPPGVEPHPAWMAAAVAELLAELGTRPPHVGCCCPASPTTSTSSRRARGRRRSPAAGTSP